MREEPAVVNSSQSLKQALSQISERGNLLLETMDKVVLGQREMLTECVIALLAHGHILLEGPPGVGKTFTLKTIAQVSGLEMKRIQCTPELMPSDIIGGAQLTQGINGPELIFREGPIFTQIFFADEINRATPRTQSALLEAMGEGQVSIEGKRRHLPKPFIVVATQNPLDHEGTYPLPEAQADRFFFKTLTPHPNKETLEGLLDFNPQEALKELTPLTDAQQLKMWSQASAQIPLSPRVRSRLLKIIIGSRPNEAPASVSKELADGLSPRAARDLYRATQIHAALYGRLVANMEDLERCVMPSLRHRLRLHWAARSSGVRPDDVIAELLRASR